MISRARLTGKVQSAADAKRIANRLLQDGDNRSKRHGSDTGIKLHDVRRRRSRSDLKSTGEQLPNDRRRPHLSKPYCSEGLKNGMCHWKYDSGISATKGQVPVAERRAGVLYSNSRSTAESDYSGEKGDESFLWRSARNIGSDRLQTVEAWQRMNLNLIDDMEFVSERGNEAAHAHEEESVEGRSADLPAAAATQPGSRRAEGGRTETALAKVWKRKKEERRLAGLLLLNGLAAVYGSSNVANKYVAEASLPASLTSLVKFSSALIFFIPSLVSAVRNREIELLRAGAELGALAFAASFVDSCNPGGSSSSSPSLLYAFTVVFVPLMEFFAGRQSGLKLTRLATLAAAILGMGVLEEEGFGWKGISCPQVSDLWGVAVSVISALHIFRSDAHGEKFNPLRLSAVQFGVLAILSLGWQMWSTFDATTTSLQTHFPGFDSLQSIPWVPLLYNGLVCSGLCCWLELRGLRSVHAPTATLVYTTIPVWGAFLSSFTSHDVSTDSALIGGLVIVATSIYAQFMSKDEEELRTAVVPRSTVVESTTISIDNANEKTVAAASRSDDYFPTGLLVSQLKFPYYAAQAKGLLAEIKFKLGALKSLGIVFGTGVSGSSAVVLPSSPQGPSALAGSSTAASTTATGANNLTSSHIGTAASSQAIDVSNAAAAVHGHGVDFATTSAMSSAHGFSNVVAHPSTGVAPGLESALVVVSSDLVMAVEEAEGVANVVGRLVQTAAESAVHVVAPCLTARGGLGVLNTIPTATGSDPTPPSLSNFVETTSQSCGAAVDVPLVTDLLMNPSHLADALVNGFTHFSDLILPIAYNIML